MPEAVREKSGRFVPPSIRLRVEEPGKAPPSAPPLQPKRQVVPQPPRVVPPAAPRPPQAATGNLARPQGQRPYRIAPSAREQHRRHAGRPAAAALAAGSPGRRDAAASGRAADAAAVPPAVSRARRD